MKRGRESINEIIQFTKCNIDVDYAINQITVNTDTLYDSQIIICRRDGGICKVGLSYDEDAGYFLSLDGVTLEYNHDDRMFISETKKYITAFVANKLKIRKKKLFGFIEKSNIEVLP